jgi:hypothetical protein
MSLWRPRVFGSDPTSRCLRPRSGRRRSDTNRSLRARPGRGDCRLQGNHRANSCAPDNSQCLGTVSAAICLRPFSIAAARRRSADRPCALSATREAEVEVWPIGLACAPHGNRYSTFAGSRSRARPVNHITNASRTARNLTRGDDGHNTGAACPPAPL